MSVFYCPICGKSLKEKYQHGDICGCCGNQCGLENFGLYEAVKLDKEYDTGILDDIKSKVPKKLLEKLKKTELYNDLPEEEYYKILRYVWINEGCPWKYNSYGEKPDNWDINIAKKQLLNLNLNLDDYVLYKRLQD